MPISFRAAADFSGGRERPPYNVRQTGGGIGDGRHGRRMTVVECCPLRRGRCLHRPAGRPGWGADACVPPPAPGHHVGRAISPAAEPCGGAGFPGRCEHCRPQAAFRSAKYEAPALSAEIAPCGTQGKALPGFAGPLRRKAAMHRLLSPAAQCQPLGKCRDPAAPVLRPAPVMIIVATLGQVNAEREAGPPVLPAPAADRKKR